MRLHFLKIQFNEVFETDNLKFYSYSKGIVINFYWLPNKQMLTFFSQTLGDAMSLDKIEVKVEAVNMFDL